MSSLSKPDGQDWRQICQLLLAVGLSAVIGIERQLRHKAAGLRTNTLVGIGSALFMLVSKYGFMDILSQTGIELDPSRIAAQIVSGIGFIGGGIIFKQQSEVRGLTTAAAVWLTAAVGSACGAGLPVLACVATALYFVTVVAFPFVWTYVRKLRTANEAAEEALITVRYRMSDSGLEPILEEVLKAEAETVTIRRIGEMGLSTFQGPDMQQSTPAESPVSPSMAARGCSRVFDVQLLVTGHKTPNEVACFLSQLPTVIGVVVEDGSADEV